MRRRPFLAALLPAMLPTSGSTTAAAPKASAASRAASAFGRSSAAVPAVPAVPAATAAMSTAPATAAASARPTAAPPSASPSSAPALPLDAPPGPTSRVATDPTSRQYLDPRDPAHRALRFPADHGAHPGTHIEWWYVTGWLRDAGGAQARGAAEPAPPDFGFQVTFFRMRTGLAQDSPSRFAARQLVFAHAALTDLRLARRADAPALLHDQRAAREGFGIAALPGADGEQVVRLRDWTLARAAGAAADGLSSHLRVEMRCEGFGLSLALDGTQPVLLQGDAGYSRKGPHQEASCYYSEPQLRVRGRVDHADGRARSVAGRAWLDHEWSDRLLPPDAAGWDWIGINLLDGGALTAFRVRDLAGRPLWAGGSWRDASGTLRVFAADEVAFRPSRRWRSPRTHAEYPVEWTIETPAGRFRLSALRDDQELDSRASTGAVYWEGLSALRHDDGRLAGWGYLELTGYLERLRL
jgi:predicted secreted hydrolase